MSEAQDHTGISVTSIGYCCKNKISFAGGYKWKYFDKSKNKIKKPVDQWRKEHSALNAVAYIRKIKKLEFLKINKQVCNQLLNEPILKISEKLIFLINEYNRIIWNNKLTFDKAKTSLYNFYSSKFVKLYLK